MYKLHSSQYTNIIFKKILQPASTFKLQFSDKSNCDLLKITNNNCITGRTHVHNSNLT